MNFIALDLGYANIRLSYNHKILFNEANCIAYDDHHKILAIGNEAKKLKGIYPVHPTLNISDFYFFMDMLFEQYKIFRFYRKTSVLFSIPAHYTENDCFDMQDHILKQGAAHVEYEQQIWCGALGAHLNVEGPVYSCMMNIGYSALELALFSKGQMLQKNAFPFAGKYIDNHIRTWITKTYKMEITESQLEIIKTSIGSCAYVKKPISISVQGIDFHQQIKSIQLDENTFAELINPIINQWVQCIYDFLKSLPAVAAQAILLRGIVICGGSSQFRYLTNALHAQLNLPFFICKDASTTILKGMEILLKRMEDYL